MRAVLAALLLLAGPAVGTSVDTIYPPQVLSAWQDNISHFANGVWTGEILPALTADEKLRLKQVAFRVPPSEAGEEPFAFRRNGDLVFLSAASMHLLGDLLMSSVWLTRNGYQEITLNDYMLMLAYWCAATPPPAPRIALFVPDNAHDDPVIDQQATEMIHGAMLFIMLHEVGHVWHNDPGADQLAPAQSQLVEISADRFALDVIARIGRMPTGILIYFELASAFDAPQRQCSGAVPGAVPRQTHPVSLERLRQVAIDLDSNAPRYVGEGTPQNLVSLRALSSQFQALIDAASDRRTIAFLPQLGPSIRPADLAPRRGHEMIAIAPGAPLVRGDFSGKLGGTITIGGLALKSEVVLQRRGTEVTGDYGLSCDFNRCGYGHLEGRLEGETLRFAWSSGPLQGSGVLVKSGADYVGSTEMGPKSEPAQWKMQAAPPP